MEAQPQDKTRLLLVEDDQMSREALAFILEVEGYAVDSAGDGQEGLELLHHSPHPAVVLLDLGLPTVDGFEFLRRQKQDQEVAHVPVVVMTALPEPSVPEAAAVVRKPLDLPKLIYLLSREVAKNQKDGTG